MHDEGKDESRPGSRITRGLKIGSEKWGVRGVCDVVEFHRKAPNYQAVVPVEYKRGKPKPHRADELQLCAQAVCLEEMMHLSIPKGYLFYGKTRRRTEVAMDSDLRELLKVTLLQIRSLCDTGKTPAAVFESTKCKACSLLDLCQPHLATRQSSTLSWFERQLATLNPQDNSDAIDR